MIRLDYIRPCKTSNISDDFADHVKRGSNLPGIDYTTKIGDAVYATAAGTVIRAVRTNNTASGIHILIRHRDGRQSWYLHLSRVLVAVGNRVKAGKVIAKSGNTGRSTGPHLHFSIMDKSGKCVDPKKLIDRDKKQMVADPAPKKPTVEPRKPKGPAVKSAKTVELPPAPVDAAE
jgi:murein DD-endopeptidase MepM/ murein hydrolase activator NlpD